jgi:hypothetical protein
MAIYRTINSFDAVDALENRVWKKKNELVFKKRQGVGI